MPLTQQNNKKMQTATTLDSDWVSSARHWKEVRRATTSETEWASYVRQYKEMPNEHYDSQWRKVSDKQYDESTISGSAPTYDRK